MLFVAYIAAYPLSADKRAALVVERSVTSIEGLLGEQLALSAMQWKHLIEAIPKFTEREWTAIRTHGRAVIDAFIPFEAPAVVELAPPADAVAVPSRSA